MVKLPKKLSVKMKTVRYLWYLLSAALGGGGAAPVVEAAPGVPPLLHTVGPGGEPQQGSHLLLQLLHLHPPHPSPHLEPGVVEERSGGSGGEQPGHRHRQPHRAAPPASRAAHVHNEVVAVEGDEADGEGGGEGEEEREEGGEAAEEVDPGQGPLDGAQLGGGRLVPPLPGGSSQYHTGEVCLNFV